MKSAVNSSFPFWNELAYTLWPLVLERIEFASLLLTGYTAYLLVRGRRRLGSWRRAAERYPAAVAASLAGIFGFLWWLGIAVETQAGFAGNPRYAVIGVMLVCVSGCAAYGWACVGLATLVARAWGRLRRRSQSPRGALEQVTDLAGGSGHARAARRVRAGARPLHEPHANDQLDPLRAALPGANLRERFAALIRRAGGAQKVIGCGAGTGAAGSVMTNNYQVTMLAWDLDRSDPFHPGAAAEVLDRCPARTSSSRMQPAPASKRTRRSLQMQAWEQAWKQKNGSQYKVVKTDPVTLYMDCSTYSKT